MGFIGVFLPLLMAFSLLEGGCWAGPIYTQLYPRRNLKKPEDIAPLDAAHVNTLLPRNATTTESIASALQPRSTGTNKSMWAVTAVVAIILLICLLVIPLVVIRRNKKNRRKAASDEELGFGKHPKAQPDLAPPPRSYHGMPASRLPPAQSVEKAEDSETLRKPPPPPLLTISPPQELGQKPTRVPVPRLPALPTSPRLIGLPPSPRLPVSPRVQRPSSGSHLYEPQRDVDMPSSPRGLLSPSLGTPSTYHDRALEVPLSAGGLERMITRMEMDLKADT